MQPTEIFELIKLKFPQVSLEEATKAVVIPKEMLLSIAACLKNKELAFDNLHCITAIDKKERFELVYYFYSFNKRQALTIKIYLLPDDLKIESLAGIWRSADWFEREVYDLFGVTFLNHPSLRRILNPDDFKGYPLRKDYAALDFIKKPQF